MQEGKPKIKFLNQRTDLTVDMNSCVGFNELYKGFSSRQREGEVEILTRQQKGVIIFDIEGDFRRTEIKDVTLHQLVKDQLDLGNKNILLNFAKVGTIDSSCVGEVVASFISITNIGGKLLRANTPEKVQIIFTVTGLDRVLPNCESIETAIESI